MEKFYGLTKTQSELMELFWNTESSLLFRDILAYTNNTLHKNWKKQTMSTYLTALQNMGMIGVDDSQYYYKYFALCTKEEHIHNWTVQLLENSYDNSLNRFVAALTGGETLTKAQADDLRKLI